MNQERPSSARLWAGEREKSGIEERKLETDWGVK